jgi:hypothetical protein
MFNLLAGLAVQFIAWVILFERLIADINLANIFIFFLFCAAGGALLGKGMYQVMHGGRS